jgi:hypothetical protein
MDLFNRFISDMDLHELPRSGPKFTWTNKQINPIKVVLDRDLVSAQWDVLYPLGRVQTLFRAGSDHNLILLILAPRDPVPQRSFSFEPSWFLEPG